MDLSYNPALALRHFSQRNENLFSHRNLHTKVHRSFICNSQRLKATQMSFNGWLVQLWYIHTMNTLYHRTNYCIMGSMFMDSRSWYAETLIPPCSSVMVFGGGAFGRLLGLDEVLRIGPSLWDWCSYLKKKRKRCQSVLALTLPPSPSLPCHHPTPRGKVRWGHPKKAAVWSQKEGLHQESSLPYFDLWLPGSTTMRNIFLLFKPPSLQYFVTATWAD